MKTLTKKLAQAGTLAGLVGASMLPQGCRTITSTSFENQIHKTETIKGPESINYFISEASRDSGTVRVKVDKKYSKTDIVKDYDELEEFQNKYRETPSAGGIIYGCIFYPLYSAITFGVIPIIDISRFLTGTNIPNNQFNTCFFESAQSNKQLISKESKGKVKRNIESQQKNVFLENTPASNIPVKANYLNRNTNNDGIVVYEIGNQVPVTIETLAQDGQNDKTELK